MPSEIAPKERIEIIDILRGFALLGIILVHFVEQYYAGAAPAIIGSLSQHNTIDEIAAGIVDVLVTGKFFLIFSFLFGLSFHLQADRKTSAAFFLRFAWRLVILFAFGFLHSLHYRGDILTIYAILGVGLLLFSWLPDRTLLIVALILVFNVPAFVFHLYQFLQATVPFPEPDQKSLETYYYTMKSGAYLDILRANYPELMVKFRFQLESGRAFITLGLFLLGLYAGRRNFFGTWRHQLSSLREYRRKAGWIILGCVLFATAFFGIAHILHLKIPDAIAWAVGGLAWDTFCLALSYIYVATVMILFTKEKWYPRLLYFYSVGRMGLTNYLFQSVLGTFLFFSYGLSMLAELGAFSCVIIAFLVFVLQAEFSKRWLTHFQFGPVEWLWRSLTYFKRPALRNNSSNG